MQMAKRVDEKELERQHVAGYERDPVRPDEFDVPEGDHVWGDEPANADLCNLAEDNHRHTTGPG